MNLQYINITIIFTLVDKWISITSGYYSIIRAISNLLVTLLKTTTLNVS